MAKKADEFKEIKNLLKKQKIHYDEQISVLLNKLNAMNRYYSEILTTQYTKDIVIKNGNKDKTTKSNKATDSKRKKILSSKRRTNI